ncbi:MAG: N-acetylmuramoyl-L-alanine amidase [Brevirhabdus sp.]
MLFAAEPTIIDHPSPNFGQRRDGAQPDMVVLHYTAMATAKAALERLCDPKVEVSAHYLIDEAGQVFRLVAEEMRAWHAGAGAWGGVTDVNSRSIGIELANPGDAPFAAAQMDALERVLAAIMARWSIPPERVIGHSDMAPDRKRDPGARFDWRRLALSGLSIWPDQTGISGHDPSWFRDFAEGFGYSTDFADSDLLSAFRQRFRPEVQGPIDALDLEYIQDLARRFPVDRTRSNA